jgi:hypothetical protein
MDYSDASSLYPRDVIARLYPTHDYIGVLWSNFVLQLCDPAEVK